jgi:RsiW-degrading membrane proteinase PrsW (M82 family)
MSPDKSITLKDSLKFLCAGCGCVVLLKVLDQIFPFWNYQHLMTPFGYYFKVVAPKEELVKLIGFCLISKSFIKSEKFYHPISYMFYFSMVGLGFAIIENIFYTETYGVRVFYDRMFTATVAHMLFGSMFGYWIGLSKIKLKTTSVLNRLLEKRKRLKFILYLSFGYLTAVFYHGLWNYNIRTSGYARETILFMLIFFGLVVMKIAYNDLNRKHKEYLKSIESEEKD